jgi:polyphenol oxidase
LSHQEASDLPLDHPPSLQRVEIAGCAYWTDLALRESGIAIAFSERAGGVSQPPYASLNFAGHVGDNLAAVDENRTRFMNAVGVGHLRDRLTMGKSAQADRIEIVGPAEAGSGAFVEGGRPPIEGVDALITAERRVPLLQSYADCVPILLVAPGPAIAFVHAGWRGALAGLPGKTALRLAGHSGAPTAATRVYIGAHIRACHYEFDDALLSQFVTAFGTFARAESGGLDLDAVVSASLINAGVARCNIARLGTCTAEATDRFFSYRAEGGVTGRHAALACIL